MKKLFSFLFTVLLISGGLQAQTQPAYDTTYIENLPETMVLRLYLSKKFTEFNFGPDLPVYEPNSGLNLGVGFTYQKFTLNLAAPPSFLNPTREKDWPGFLDLQVHYYPQKWIIDLFAQFYNGYVIPDFEEPDQKYLREDVRVRKFGVNANYVFLGDRVSMAAAKDQSQIQKKSAISPTAGLEAYRVKIQGDSLVVPGPIGVDTNYLRGDFFQIGPNVGVLGTLVFGKGFFLTGDFSYNVGLGYSQSDQIKESREWEIVTGYFFRGFLGYNNRRFTANINYVYKHLNLAEHVGLNPSANTGNYRFNIGYKIQPGPKFKKTYNKFNPVRIMESIFKKN